MTNLISQGWGFLIALLPSRENGVVDDVFVQPDLPVSVADYLDLDRGRRQFTGRSVFRRYHRPREVYWGNTHLGMVAGLTLENLLVTCTEDFRSCGTRAITGTSLFSPAETTRAATEDEIAWLKDAANRSLRSSPERLHKRRFTLIAPGIHPVPAAPKEQYLFGGQFVSMPARTTARVEIEVEVTGAKLRLSYSVNTEVSLKNVECRLWVTDLEGDGLGLDFKSATLTLEPFVSAQPVAEVIEHEFEVTGRRPE